MFENTYIEECIFCMNVTVIDQYHINNPPPFEVDSPPYALLIKKNNCMATLGVGALTPGYILIVPSRHYLNVGELSEEEFDNFIEIKETIATFLINAFGGGIFFEHGSSKDCIASGACIEHAHMHAIPRLGMNFKSMMPEDMKEMSIKSVKDLRGFSSSSYLYLEESPGEAFVYLTDKGVESQFFRRMWATQLGVPDKFDWALFPEPDNMLRTMLEFKAFTNSKGT